MLETVLIVLHLVLALGLVGLVLLQHGKGADAGAAFGSGASSTVFGSRGSSNFLSRTTGVLAAMFFATSLTLAYFAMQRGEQQGIMISEPDAEPPAQLEVPATTDTPPASGDVPVAPDLPAAPGLPAPPTDSAPASSGTGDVPTAPAGKDG